MPKLTAQSVYRDLSIGEVAARSGVALSALRFYERKGLIHCRRSSGNQRRYAREVLRRVAVIRVAQRIGIPLAEVRRVFAALPEGRTPTTGDWRRLSRRWREELTRRIARVTQLRDHLADCIGCGCLSLASCPLRNPWDRLSERGTGAALLEPRPRAGARSRPVLR